MSFLKSLASKLGRVLALYGGWGLFAISFLDSSFVAFPLVNDLLLIHLSSQHPERMLVYVAQATAGSVLGAYALYGVGRGGLRFLARRPSAEKMSRAKRWLGRNDFVAVVVASLLPPPMPFKVFLFAAGALGVNGARFGAALLIGRGLRFGAEAWLGARYGAGAAAYLKENFHWVSLVIAALVAGMALVYRRFQRKSQATRDEIKTEG